jgi:uncharacterized protein YfaS (alpha-2-macroglobulin family)
MRRFIWLVLACLLLTGVARAQDFELPGVAADADAYANSLTKRFPAGATPAARQQAERAAAAAMRDGKWDAAAEALQTRAGQGEMTTALWRDLATAQLRRTQPDAKAALSAAWLGFGSAENPAAEVAPLMQMVDALVALDQPGAALQAAEQAATRAPKDAAIATRLAGLRAALGVVVRRVTTNGETNPPRACIEFALAPRQSDLNPQDWVRADPAVPGMAVTREGKQFCLSGLPSGTTTRVILKAGLPGEGGRPMPKDTVLAISIPNRKPRIGFDGRLFVLPRGQTTAVTLNTVNLSAVALKLIRFTERNVASVLREAPLGDDVAPWLARNLAENAGRVVWEGKADIATWTVNRTARTALPIPDALKTAGPGLYALVAEPGDGSTSGGGAVQIVLRTDLAPTVWRGSDGLAIQMRSYADATPRPGVRLVLLAKNNDILAETQTDADGVARFAAPLLAGEGPVAPASVQAFAGEDFATLDLNGPGFDLSDRGVEGMPHPGKLDAYVWPDRGIYRPGETVQVMALLRDAAGLLADIPARITIKRPNGQVFLRATPPRLADAAMYLPLQLSAGAAAGMWSIDVHADPDAPPIGHAEFRVDAFVPDRMAVDFGTLPDALVAGQEARIPVTARFLYGAPGAGLSGHAQYNLAIDPAPFPNAKLDGYRFGLVDEPFAPDTKQLDLPETDAQGRTTLAITLPRAPDTTHPLIAGIDLGIDDPAGRASRAGTEIRLRPAGPMIGIKPLFDGGAVNDSDEAGFDIAAVAPDGTRTKLATKLRLVKEVPSWNLVFRGSYARYEVQWRDQPLETRDLAIAETGAKFSRKLDFGRYRLEVTQAGGLAATSIRFRAGWAGGNTPDVPDAVDVSTATPTVKVGANARVHIAPPFAGLATIAVLSDRVLWLRDIEVPAGGTDVDVPVDVTWGPGAYVAVHLFRSVDKRPARAIGLTWVGVDPAARTLDMAILTPERAAPRAPLDVPVRAAPGAYVSLAAVDEGILRLTRFASPDPKPHFLGRRRLGLDIRDDWGRLIAPAEGGAALLRQGGDDGGLVLPDIPQRTVTLFSPPVQAGADGVAHIKLDIPDFNGEVRLMAVGWQASRIGAASKPVVVRDPVIAEALLPRFLAPGDEARLAILLHDLDLPSGEAKVTLKVEGALELAGPAALTVALQQGVRTLQTSVLRATGAGTGKLTMQIAGPGDFRLTRTDTLAIRPARAVTTLVSGGELAPGAAVTLDPGAARFIPGAWKATVTFGAPVRYDAAAMARALADYPWSCLEQATSRGLPLAMLPDGAMAGPDRAARLLAAIASVLDHQRYDGGFGLWSGLGEAEAWLTPYAVDFLLRARDAGAPVPDQALSDALKFLTGSLAEAGDRPEDRAATVYTLYILARANLGQPGAARVLVENLDALPTPLARAQLGAALALAHDTPRAEAAFAAALDAPARRWWATDYGTPLRDQLAIAVLLKESGLLPDRLAKLRAALPGADVKAEAMSTQEQAWAVAAAAALGKDGRPAHIAVGTADLTAPVVSVAVEASVAARNLSDRPVWQSLAVSGVPAQAPPPARAGMRITRQFLTLTGDKLDLDQLKQNTMFYLVLEGRAEDGQDHRALVTAGLPAGWEIAARLGEGEPASAGFLGKLSATEAQPAADDRYAAVVALTGKSGDFRLAVRLRAVTPGNFELPGAEVADMYRPGVFARQAAGRVTVLPAE